jgi:hypothetical protein
MASRLNNLKHLITFNFKIENEGCASLQPCDLKPLTWLAGWLADVERCSCIKEGA